MVEKDDKCQKIVVAKRGKCKEECFCVKMRSEKFVDADIELCENLISDDSRGNLEFCGTTVQIQVRFFCLFIIYPSLTW